MGKQRRHRHGNVKELGVERTADIPLREVSGLCLANIGGAHRVMAIGDSTTRLAHAVMSEQLEWTTVDLAELLKDLDEDDPQLEGITADGSGCVLLLQEGPARAVAIDTSHERRVCVLHLEVTGSTELARSWRDDGTSRGEAIVLMHDGHLLVAKEKRPPALIEFGPAGDSPLGITPTSLLAHDGTFAVPQGAETTYIALAVWLLDDEAASALGDISDAAVGPDGRLYLLSDQSASIARAAWPAAPATDRIGVDEVWAIEDEPEKAEGLAILPDGRAVVALDTKHAGDNLLLLGHVAGGATTA